MRRWITVLTVLILSVGLGCDKKPAPRSEASAEADKKASARAERRSAAEQKLPGTWEMVVGEKEAGKFYSVMTLELRADKTLAWSNVMPDLADKTKTIVNKATGRWELDERGVRLTVDLLASPDGRPIPEEQRRIELSLGTEGNPGTRRVETVLIDPRDMSRTFHRK